jgi:alkylation response protein AidB-like acyl-CoA dehydrogenase
MIWWQTILGNKGWMVRNWPEEYGGTGWTHMQHHIFGTECARAGTPAISGFGVVMVGPVIYTFGNEEQKKRFLPGIASGETLWCQGYSEPGSGSDLASLSTRAVREGDHYIVNGQKTWTTQAHWAEHIFCLVRTDPDVKKQAGISFLLIDMNSPGVEVRPITSIDNSHHLNEVYFTDVKVPVENRIGEENKGWTYAKFLLSNERVATAGTSGIKSALDSIKALARSRTSYTSPLSEEPGFSRHIADLERRLIALQLTEMRALDADSGSFDAAKLSLPLKLLGTELQQDVAEAGIDLLGYAAMPTEYDTPPDPGTNELSLFEQGPEMMRAHLFGRASTIYGGSSEVQKNIMSKMVLGL